MLLRARAAALSVAVVVSWRCAPREDPAPCPPGTAAREGVCIAELPECGPSHCEGCCDANGVCRLGLEDQRCGAQGEACTDCTGDELSCRSGQCLPADPEVERVPLTCEIAAADPTRYPCNFCTADGAAVLHCAFCHEDPFTTEDQLEPCDPGTKCYEWNHPDTGEHDYACSDREVLPCSQSSFDDHCDEDTVVRCGHDGRISVEDCADYDGVCRLGYANGATPTCVAADAQRCDPASHVARCDGDELIYCSSITLWERNINCLLGLNGGRGCATAEGVADCIRE